MSNAPRPYSHNKREAVSRSEVEAKGNGVCIVVHFTVNVSGRLKKVRADKRVRYGGRVDRHGPHDVIGKYEGRNNGELVEDPMIRM